MLAIEPFRALRFNRDRVRSLDDVITPPFDVITPDQRRQLAARDPHNMVHVILPEAEVSERKYESAAQHYRDWMREGVLRDDAQPGYYLLEQHFRGPDGLEHTRRVLYALAKIPEAGESIVLGHEKTFRHKIEDRLALLRATHVQPGAVFVLYHDEAGRLAAAFDRHAKSEPVAEATTIDGVRQRFWSLPADTGVHEYFEGRRIYIGDGHHRFATAQAFRDECRASGAKLPGAEYILLGFVAFEDPGLLVYPAHRLVSKKFAPTVDELRARLGSHFSIEPARGDIMDAVARSNGVASFGLALPNGERYAVTLKNLDRESLLGSDHGPAWRSLDVSLLHRGIFERLLGLPADTELAYEPDPQIALARCDAHECGMAWFVKAASPAQIEACADAGEYMPQKATYLFPKLPTGGVMYNLENVL